jgi:predicted amidophosphoribosyltransferase
MATAGGKSEPDDYMIKFHPMDCDSGKNDYDSSTLRYLKDNSVRNQSRRSEFEVRVKEWLKQYIKKHLSGETVVLAVAPGHKAYDNSSFMHNLVKKLITDDKLGIEDGCSLLVRYKTIKKQATSKGKRHESTHRESIRIKDSDGKDVSQLNKDKVVIILDDVWTSGCTLRMCEEKVRTTGPKDVRLLAIGKTV